MNIQILNVHALLDGKLMEVKSAIEQLLASKKLDELFSRMYETIAAEDHLKHTEG